MQPLCEFKKLSIKQRGQYEANTVALPSILTIAQCYNFLRMVITYKRASYNLDLLPQIGNITFILSALIFFNEKRAVETEFLACILHKSRPSCQLFYTFFK